MQSKSWAKVLTDSASGGELLHRARQLLRLRELAERILPESLHPGYSLASYKPGEAVVFIASSAAIAAKIRFFDANLRESFAKNGFDAPKIRVEVEPLEPRPSRPSGKHAALSPAAARSLADLAGRLPDDSPLASAIRSLVESATQPVSGPSDRSNKN